MAIAALGRAEPTGVELACFGRLDLAGPLFVLPGLTLELERISFSTQDLLERRGPFHEDEIVAVERRGNEVRIEVARKTCTDREADRKIGLRYQP